MENLEGKFLKAYDKYSNQIFRYIYVRTFDREIAKELMQDTFEKIWDYMKGRNPIENLKAFTYKIAKNLIIDHSRKKKEIYLGNITFDPDYEKQGFVREMEILNSRIEFKKLIEKLNELPEKYAEIITLRFIEDMRIEEIAEILSVTENVVSVRINRGIQKLQKLIN